MRGELGQPSTTLTERPDMKPILALVALALAVPAAAQTAPAAGEKPKMECCCKDKDKPMACCPEHGEAGKPAKDGHEGHDMAKPNG